MMKTPEAFRARTRALDKVLRQQTASFDVVLQAGGLFAPFEGEFPKPVCLWCDYTTKLAELKYPPWFGLNPSDAPQWYVLEEGLYRRCARIFTTSESTRASFIQHYGIPAERVQVVGVGVHQIFEHKEKPYNENTVLFVGIDFERKGGPALLKAFAEVKRRLPAAKLLIAGPRSGAVQPGVEWLGHLTDRERIQEIFAQATVFAIPSVCDPFPRVVFEAMSHGLPVVGSRADGIPEMIREGKTGFLVATDDERALAERLYQLLSSSELCASLGTAGRAEVRERFMWHHVVDRIVGGLKQVCDVGAERLIT
jgi:alpha-maltose-1-phosphate synthase